MILGPAGFDGGRGRLYDVLREITEMKPTQKQLGGELEELVRRRKRLESLRVEGAPSVESMKELTGCFTGDEEWAAIFEDIERQRRIPDASSDAS